MRGAGSVRATAEGDEDGEQGSRRVVATAGDPCDGYVMPAINGANAAKASRMRRLVKDGKALDPVDKLWLAEYDEETARREKARRDRRERHGIGAAEVGASRKERTLQVNLHEEAEAAGTGPTAAAIAAGAALEAKEEGRRLDSLTVNSLEIMKEAVSTYRDIALTLRKHWAIMAATVSDALAANTHNRNLIAELEAENVALRGQLEQKGETPEQMLMAAAMQHVMGRAAQPNGAPAQGNPGKNGQG